MSYKIITQSNHQQFNNNRLVTDTNTKRQINNNSPLTKQQSSIARHAFETPHANKNNKNNVVNNNNNNEEKTTRVVNSQKQTYEELKRSRIVDKTYLLKLKEKKQRLLARNSIQPTTANVAGTKFEIVRLAIEAMGLRIADNDNFDCNLIWDDSKISMEAVSDLRPYQRYNHFPAMSEISRKDALARNFSKLNKLLPNDFNFMPQTWILPSDYLSLCSYATDCKKAHQKKTFILKPSNSACGHGIKLYKTVEKIQPNDNYIVQEYIGNPYLLDGYKFDLRIYVLVTSCDPLRAFIFNDGLVRLGTEHYQEPSESNIDHLYMHLTNYSLNKYNTEKYDEGDRTGQTGTKRTLRYFMEHLKRKDKDVTKLWREIQDVCLKTLLIVEPYLFHSYKMCRPGQSQYSESVCFEILGFDILLDENLKPWLLEINRSPSFGSDHQVDFDVKSRLLLDCFNLIRFRGSDRRRSLALEKAEAQRRLYNCETYSNRNEINGFYQNSNSDKNVKIKQKKLFDLIEQLKIIRRARNREDYENINLGNFSRLFPIDDRSRMEDCMNILNHSFNLFYPVGKQCTWKKTFERIREEDIVDKIIEFDDENNNLTKELSLDNTENIYKYLNQTATSESEYSDTDMKSDSENEMPINHYQHRPYKTQANDKQLPINRPQQNDLSIHSSRNSNNTSRSSMSDQLLNTNTKRIKHDDNNNKENNDGISSKYSINLKRKAIINQSILIDKSIKINSKLQLNRNSSYDIKNRQLVAKSIERSVSSIDKHTSLYDKAMASIKSSQNIDSTVKGNLETNENTNKFSDHLQQMSLISLNERKRDEKNDDEINHNEYDERYNEKLAMAVFKMLTQLDIKFPGKNTQQAKSFLNEIYSKFEEHKQNIGNYWMVKLDDAKRTKIIEIVKSNLIVILKRAYSCEILDNLRLYKIFLKLLNRMLWMHGQGLWNSFQNINNSSWETIFSKSSFIISEIELKCCHRVIDLCKDCVLIVYQYALEQKQLLTSTAANNKNLNSKSTTLINIKDETNSNNNLLKRKPSHKK